jgi:hypothetical protein
MQNSIWLPAGHGPCKRPLSTKSALASLDSALCDALAGLVAPAGIADPHPGISRTQHVRLIQDFLQNLQITSEEYDGNN